MIKRESFFFLIKNREIGVIVRFKLIWKLVLGGDGREG